VADLFGTYDKRIKLTIDHTKVDSDLSDFPVTVFFTATQAEEIFTEFDADSDYMKCAFTASDGTTQLYAEKELFNIGYTSQYPPAQSDTYVKATTKANTDTWAYYATDPARPLTGTFAGWESVRYSNTNQRFHIDLGSAKIIKRIYYENLHSEGGFTDRDVKNFTFWGSNTSTGTFDDLVYGNDEGWTQITTSQSTFDEHVALDQADPKYITVTNSTAYRYYAFKFADNYGDADYMGVRRIELQTEDPKAIYHVKVTSVSSSAGTDIYYYYDNDASDNTTYIGAINTTAGGNVWDSDFKAVYHMTDATTSTILDSTSNSNDGTKLSANNPIEAVGKIGQGQDFSSDYIDAGNNASLDFTSALTMTALIKADTGGGYAKIAVKPAGSGWSSPYFYYCLGAGDSSNYKALFAVKINTNEIYSDVLNTGQWYLFTGTYNGSIERLYVDTTEVNTKAVSGDISTSVQPLAIGARSTTDVNEYFDGIIDELRLSSVVRNAAWVKATYNSLWDSLLTYGSEEEAPPSLGNSMMFGINF